MSSALEILLVAAVIALFFGASRLVGPMRDAGRMAGELRRRTTAATEPVAEEPTPRAALPRPPAAG